MKKALILILTLLLLSTLVLFAADLTSYIRLYDASFSVDLASNKFLSHVENSTYSSITNSANLRKTGFYYQSQELGVVGLSDTNKYDTEMGDIVFTISVDNGWFYKLPASDYRRPYGIDVFARGRFPNGTEVDLGCLRLGYQSDVSENPETTSIVISAADVLKYKGIWWDLVLVMDPEVDTVDDTTRFRGNDYFITASDRSYTTDVTVTINTVTGYQTAEEEITKSISFPIHLEGFYKPSEFEKTSITASFTITRVADILRLDGADGLLAKVNANPSQGTDFTTIADYSLNTSAVTSSKTDARKIRMFLSSSNDAKVSGGLFVLRHEYDATAPILLFKAAMTSESTEGKGHAPGSDNKTVVFDGTDTFTPKTDNANYALPANHLEIDATTTLQKSGSTWYASWIDTGSIGIALTGQILQNGVPVTATGWTNQGVYTLGGNTQALTKGEYKSTIYIHVVTF